MIYYLHHINFHITLQKNDYEPFIIMINIIITFIIIIIIIIIIIVIIEDVCLADIHYVPLLDYQSIWPSVWMSFWPGIPAH